MSVISLIKFNKFILIIFSNYSFEVNTIKTKEIENKRNILHSYFSTISHSLLKMLEKGRPGIYTHWKSIRLFLHEPKTNQILSISIRINRYSNP